MRIISQCGKYDFPYENIILEVMTDSNSIFAYTGTGQPFNVGDYSTKDKAVKAMKMLRERYLSRMELDGGFDVLHNCYVQPNFGVLPKIFQFPTDDEVVIDEA